MSSGITVNRVEDRDAKRVAQQVVFVMAVSSTALGVLYLMGLVGKLIVDGTVHSVSSPPVQIVSAIVAILLDITLLIMFAAMRWQISGQNQVFAELAVIMMTLVCATSSINWFVQLAVVPRIAEGGEGSWLALVDVHNSGSAMYAIEHLGWGIFYGLATIFMAISMGGGRLEALIRWLFVAGGTLSILHVFGIVAANPTIGDLGYVAWGVLLPATTAILAVRSGRK